MNIVPSVARMLWITLISVFGLVSGAPFGQQPAPCDVCHLLIGELQDYLTTDQSQISVKSYVRDICTKLPSTEKDTCLQFTENYAELIFSKLNKDLSPESFCQKQPEICPKLQEEEVKAPRVQDDAGCEICQLLVTYLDQILKDNGTAATINDTLYKICDAAPDSFKQTCYVLVPSIESFIQAGFDPKQACTLANFCQNNTASDSCEMCQLAALTNSGGMFDNKKLDTTCAKLCDPADKSVEAEEPRSLFNANVKPCEGKGAECKEAGCVACKVLIQGLDLVVGANFTVDTINTTMTDICNKMVGESTKDACLKTVPKVVKLLKTGLPAEEACKVVGLCETEETIRRTSGETTVLGSKMKHFAMLNNDFNMKKESEKPGCILCEGVGKALNTVLKNNITIASVNSTLQDICVNLPADSLQRACFGAIPNILKISKTGLNITDLCLKSKLCTEKGAVVSAIKARKVRSVTFPKSQFNLKCDICEFVIDELDKELNDNSTQKMINSTVYGICDKLQGAFQDVCLQSAPQVVTTIEQGFNTSVVCALIKLCNLTTPYKQAQEIQRKENVNGDLKCDVCKYVVTEVDKRIGKNATVEKINQTVYELCEKLTGSLALLCKAAAPEIVKQLAGGGDPEKVCEDIKLCTSSEYHDETEEDKLDSNLECDICKYLITEAEKRLTLNATIQKINETMFNICSDLFGNLKKLCYAATPQIVTALQGGEEPGKVCTKVDFCASMTIVKALEVQKPLTEPTKLSSNVQGVECDLCELVIKEVDSLLLRNTTIKDINATVYEFCSTLPGTLKDFCLNFAPQIVQTLEAGLDPKKACEIIKLCSPSGIQMTLEKTKTENLHVDLACDVCKFAVQEVDKFLAENSSGLVINSTIYSACNRLTGTFQDLCYSLAPSVVQTIEDGADPHIVCELLTVCSSRDLTLRFTSKTKLISQAMNGLNGPECDLCEFAVKELDSLLASNASAEKINATVYQICSLLPDSLKLVCLSVAPQAVSTIESGIDPDAACTFIGLCTNMTTDVILSHENFLDCNTCQRGLNEIWYNVHLDYAKVEALLFNLCGRLPSEYRSTCVFMVEQDNGVLFKKFIQSYSPVAMCEMAGCMEFRVETGIQNLS